MKIKKIDKKWIILVLVVLVYLIVWVMPVREKKNTFKTLPAITDVTQVVLQLPQTNEAPRKIISLFKDEDIAAGWGVSKKKYLAEEQKVKKLVETFAGELKLEVVSLSRAYESYDVDEKRSLRILLKNNDKLLREVRIGKSGNRYKTRYVALNDDNIIYVTLFPVASAIESIESADDFRVKLAFSYSPEKLSAIIYSPKQGVENTLRLSQQEAEETAEVETEKELAPQVIKRIFAASSGETFTQDNLPEAVQAFQNLNARAFFNWDDTKNYLDGVPEATYTFIYEDGSAKTTHVYGRFEEGYAFIVEGVQQGYFLPFAVAETILKGF